VNWQANLHVPRTKFARIRKKFLDEIILWSLHDNAANNSQVINLSGKGNRRQRRVTHLSSVDRLNKDHTHTRREGMRSRAPRARLTLVRVDASLPCRTTQRHYGSAPINGLSLHIVFVLLATLASLAVWGSVVYGATRFVKEYW
jgi:hypothetical protein